MNKEELKQMWLVMMNSILAQGQQPNLLPNAKIGIDSYLSCLEQCVEDLNQME